MSSRSWFRSFLLATLLASSCAAHGGAVWVVDVAPPAPRVVTVTPRPGMVWIDGHWQWFGGRWIWSSGYWERERPGYMWTPGVWVQAGGHWRWNQGRWNPRPRVIDHRDDRPRVREHR